MGRSVFSYAAALLFVLASVTFAQKAPDASGHWEGSLTVPDQEIKLELDMARDAKGTWKGTIGIPEQKMKGLELGDIHVEGDALRFTIKHLPGQPSFECKVDASGQSISGSLRQEGSPGLPVKLSRTGEAKFAAIEKSTAVSKEFLGSWEGALYGEMKLVLKIVNQPDGTAVATLTNTSQNNMDLPVATVKQTANNLTLVVTALGSTYEGDINKDGTMILGEWIQGEDPSPLVFKRPGAK